MAKYNFETKNESFHKTARELRIMGVTNTDFLFSYKTDMTDEFTSDVIGKLSDIDPFDPNITTAEKNVVKVNAANDIWYFLRECVRIKDPNSDDPDAYFNFELNPYNAAQIYLYENGIDTFIDAPRQAHKSTTLHALALYSYNRIFPFSHRWAFITNSNREKYDLKEKFSNIILPPYLFRIGNNVSVVYTDSDDGVCTMINAIKLATTKSHVHVYDDFESLGNIETFHLTTHTAVPGISKQTVPVRMYAASIDEENIDVEKVNVDYLKYFIGMCLKWDPRLFNLSKNELEMYFSAIREIYGDNNHNNTFYIKYDKH